MGRTHMKSPYQETLRRVEENDAELTELLIYGYSYRDGVFTSTDGDEFSRLGAAIRGNTHLTQFEVVLDYAVALDVTNNNEFYEGLKLNSSIHKFALRCQNSNIAGGVGQKMLEAYQQNKNLTELSITRADLQNGGENLIAQTLRNNTNLKQLILYSCDLTDEQLLPIIIDGIRGHPSLEYLSLDRNRIGNAGCEAIATLLSDPISNLHTLNLLTNLIHNEGAITLANGLANNTKLRELWLNGNSINQSSVDIFKKLLCNGSSINDTYFSNHTLETLGLSQSRGDELESLLNLNKCTNKSHVAIKKILKYHPIIDMEPFFEWNMEGDGERNLKALPYIIAWFERAGEAVANDEGGNYNIDARKLSAMYQFAKAMPLLFVTASHMKGGSDNKRKRGS